MIYIRFSTLSGLTASIIAYVGHTLDSITIEFYTSQHQNNIFIGNFVQCIRHNCVAKEKRTEHTHTLYFTVHISKIQSTSWTQSWHRLNPTKPCTVINTDGIKLTCFMKKKGIEIHIIWTLFSKSNEILWTVKQ